MLSTSNFLCREGFLRSTSTIKTFLSISETFKANNIENNDLPSDGIELVMAIVFIFLSIFHGFWAHVGSVFRRSLCRCSSAVGVCCRDFLATFAAASLANIGEIQPKTSTNSEQPTRMHPL